MIEIDEWDMLNSLDGSFNFFYPKDQEDMPMSEQLYAQMMGWA